MQFVGLLMVVGAVLVMVLTDEALPVAFAAAGIVFVGVGARRRRTG